MTKPQKCSSTWSAMLGCKSEMKEGCCWAVGNGEKIHIKTDPWILKLHNKRPIPNFLSTEQLVLVSELILQNPPSEEGTEDKLLWLHHPNGVFTAKSFIKTLNDRAPSSSHYGNAGNIPWKKFWQVKVLAPNLQIFAWIILNNGIAVGSRMMTYYKDINTECRMCNGVVETLEHLFLYCPVSQAVLFASHLTLRIDASLNLSVHHYIKSWLLEGGDYSKLKMGICLFWSIWKTRNNIVFNKGTVHIQKMLQETYYWFHRDTNIQNDTTLPSEQDLLDSAETVWSPPTQSKMKINFDGAAGIRGFACAAVARNYNCEFNGCQTQVFAFSIPVEAEAHGALVGIELAISKAMRHIIVEGDSLTVINSLKYNNFPVPWRIKNTIGKIKDKLGNFTSVDFNFIKKEANFMAHSLAAYAVQNQLSNQWLTSPPSCITHLFSEDSSS
ncbi:uncharacterized protein LOC113342437 [Papaver somniferum]|uniref:uncharacterized protein LOC113342437 n=1 Tax=Papaver somniferum TaxID=3469 RepID=UPI000E7015F9|nr:uncharacterized protein LOC113342437 [Papaver somniferum]